MWERPISDALPAPAEDRRSVSGLPDATSSVDGAAMSDADYGDEELLPVAGIDDARGSDPQAAKTLPFGAHGHPVEGIVKQALDGGHSGAGLADPRMSVDRL